VGAGWQTQGGGEREEREGKEKQGLGGEQRREGEERGET